MVDYADLPALEQKVAASVTEMVTQHGLNAVLSGAVNAAFEAGSSDPVAFMGNYMVERIDRVPALSELAPKEVLSSACDPVLRVDVSCCVNGVHKVFGSATAPSVAQFEATPVAEAPVEGEQTPEPLPSVQALMEQVRGAALGGMDPRGQQALDAHVLSLGLHPAATITISSALAQAGAAVSSLVSFQPVAPWQHLHAQHAAAPAHMPTMMVPMLSCGPGMHVDLILRGGGGWSAALQQATKVFACLQQREGCTLDVLTGLVCCPAAPAPDPKQKEPKPGHDVLGDALCVMEEAVAAAGLALCVDQGLCFAVWVHADQQCTAQHTEGTDATEEQEAVPASTEYMYDVCPNAAGAGGAPCSTRSEVMVQYYAALVAAHPAVHVLGDPLGAQDQPGWAALVESLHVQTHAELLLAGAALYSNQTDAVHAAGQRAADKEQPWASAVLCSHSVLHTASAAAELAEVVRQHKGTVVWEGLEQDSCTVSADIAVGIHSDFVRLPLPCAATVSKFNRFLDIETEIAALQPVQPKEEKED